MIQTFIKMEQLEINDSYIDLIRKCVTDNSSSCDVDEEIESLNNFNQYMNMGVNQGAIINSVIYGLICLLGIVGNSLVIIIVLRYSTKKTVTDWYIANLAIADLCFLVGLPLLITTLILERWVFGLALCRLFYISTSINWFTSVFTLTVMAADRYMAVCQPIRSITYRTPFIARAVCACVWGASILVMIPIMMFTTTKPHRNPYLAAKGWVTCAAVFPVSHAEEMFILYTMAIGFAIPVILISVFYSQVVMRLRTVGPIRRSHQMNRTHRRVTLLVLTVITVYVICWLPYWLFQVILMTLKHHMPSWSIILFQVIMIFSYANSTINPILYAFFNENFRTRFHRAFKCCEACGTPFHSMASGSNATGCGIIGASGKSCKIYTAATSGGSASARRASRGLKASKADGVVVEGLLVGRVDGVLLYDTDGKGIDMLGTEVELREMNANEKIESQV